MDTAVDELVTHRMVDVGEVTLHVAEAGTGPLVVLLHGFPEFWYGWRHQIPALAAAGYRVAAPDLRGYGLSDKPRGEAAYGGPALTGDVAGLVRALGEQRAVVVGHDWGGVIAWLTAMSRPEVVDRLVVANAPHPAVFGRALASPAQLLRSSYMGFFQLPAVPELLLGAGGATVLRRLLRAATVRPDAFTEADLARYAEAFAEPGALSGALAYYRSMGRSLAADGGARLAARLRRQAPAPRPPDHRAHPGPVGCRGPRAATPPGRPGPRPAAQRPRAAHRGRGPLRAVRGPRDVQRRAAGLPARGRAPPGPLERVASLVSRPASAVHPQARARG